MGSFFQPRNLRQYDLRTRYYDEEKERMDELRRRVGEDAAEGEERSERIREAYERKRSRRTKPKNKILSGTRILVYIALVILLVMMISNTKFLLF
jgi:hypothetical protein